MFAAETMKGNVPEMLTIIKKKGGRFMARLLLRCRDAGMMGPFCDYITEAETFDEAVRELRVHAKTHHERDITDEEVAEMKRLVEKEGGKSQ